MATRTRTDLRDELEELIPAPEPEQPDEDEQLLEEVRAEARAWLALPADASLEEIQAEFADSLRDFWIWFFPHYRENEAGEDTGMVAYQADFLDALQALVLGEPGDTLVRAYPREHAKSVLGSFTTILWAVAHHHRRFPFLFSDTDTQAWGFLEDIRLELETNERLQAIYPEICRFEGKPRVNRLVLSNGATIMAAGSGKSVRGARKRAQRPDMIVLDDIENDEEVANPQRRRKKMVWYNKVVRKLGRAAVYLIIGTILHADSFLSSQLRSDEDVFAAVITDAERQDLWQQWEEILRDRGRKSAEADARAFYETNRAEMDRGAEILWPGKFSLYGLYTERAEDLASYLSERQNKPFDPTASWFPEDSIAWLSREEIADAPPVLFSVLFWDPSRGTATGDTSSAPRLDVLEDGTRLVSWAVADRIPPEGMMDIIIGAHQKRRFDVVGVEKVGLSSYDEQLQARAKASQVSLPVEAVTPVGKKDLRIKSLRPLIVSRTMGFADDLPLEAQRQLSFFPNYPHDDFPDAVQQANQMADEFLTDVAPAGAVLEPQGDAGRIEHASIFGEEDLTMPHAGERAGLIERAWI